MDETVNNPPGTGKVSEEIESQKETDKGDASDVFLFPPDNSRHRFGSSSSVVSNGGYLSAQDTPQNRSGAGSVQSRARESQIEKECDNIDMVLLNIKKALKPMYKAMAKQKGIKKEVKDGIVEIDSALGAIFDFGIKIREIVRGQSSNASSRVAPSSSNKRARDGMTIREETPTKKSRKETGEENEWRTVSSHRKKKSVPADVSDEKSDTAAAENRKPKVRKRRNDVVVIQPGAEKTYAQILRTLKEKMNPEASGAAVRSVRKTKSGAVLLELNKGTADNETFRSSIQDAIGDAGQVKNLVSTTTIEIWDLDCLATKEDVQNALVKETGCTADFKVHVFGPNSREQKMALATANAQTASLLLEKGRIKIGWTNCRIRQRVTVTRCHRCLSYGHVKANCNGKDRSAACWKCGKDGHKAKECRSRPDTPGCFLCLEKPEIKDKAHFPGSGSCSVFRAALAHQKKTPAR